ncbi:ras-related protein rab-7a [Gorgonomyces haynaldii]|nr:ras-related protein rab-7a [Gorgonomyces haynaldii]
MSLKIVVLGNAGVGKTAVRNQFLHTNFTNQYKATIGVDFVTKQCTVERDGQEQQVQLQIWDTAGQERFQSIGTSFYRGCDACVFVYDITNQESLNALSNWMTQFLKFSGVSNPETFPFFIVGNKIDLEADRQVSHAQTQDFDMQVHREYSPDEIPFLETSAKSGEGIDLLFQFIAQNTPVPESDDGFTIHPVQVLETSRTSSCC